MPTTIRKLRARDARESLILDTAQRMLHEHGFAYLTMDRVAAAVRYSKGTLYNHFSSKEDMICALCCRCMSDLVIVFEHAASYPGTTRERFSAIGLGYAIYHQQHPLDTENIQIVKSHAIRKKIAPDKVAQIDALERQLTGIAMRVVRAAIACGELDKRHEHDADSLVFGYWSMHYGAVLLEQSDIPLHQLGFSPVMHMLWRNAQQLLDGYGWKPESDQLDSQQLYTTLSASLFARQHNPTNPLATGSDGGK